MSKSHSLLIFLGILIVISGSLDVGGQTTSTGAISLSPPTGGYPVGTVVYKWTDEKRADIVSGIPGNKRRLVVQVWFPADAAPNARHAPYMPEIDVLAPAFKQGLDQLRSTVTNSYWEVPMIKGRNKFPVIVFSHGMGVPRSWYTMLMEELASNGYVAVAIDHPYMGLVAINGKIVRPFKGWTEPPPGGLANATDEERDRYWRTSFEQLSADQRFVLDQMTQLNGSDPDGRFTNRLDLKHVGFMGHSQGFVSETCGVDLRIKACLNLEGVPNLTERRNGLPQPFMTMRDGDDSPRMTTIYEQLKQPGYDILIHGAGHNSYLDTPIAAGYKYQLDPPRAHEVINAYMLAFFDTYLRSKPSDLLKHPSKTFPEVTFTTYPAK
jgi:hypothetical protein